MAAVSDEFDRRAAGIFENSDMKNFQFSSPFSFKKTFYQPTRRMVNLGANPSLSHHQKRATQSDGPLKS